MPDTYPSSQPAPPAVDLRQASKIYGSVRAADRVTLRIDRGEFFTILGSSGSGKTTTLRLIGGFELPDEGSVVINGDDVSARPAHKRDVHTVFQDYALFPHLSVFENVAFAPRIRGTSRARLKDVVTEALRLVQLTGFESRKPAQLSGGQQQRVALARAIVDRPAVLLLDEPLSALDAKIRGEVREELKRLQRETGITFVYVTHDQEEALTMSDRMAVMRGGRVLQVGTPLEVYERPADLFVAQFIGKANFIAGKLERVDRTRGTVVFNGTQVDATLSGPIPEGTNVMVMVRPENFNIRADAPGALSGTIQQAHFLGHATEYVIACNDSLFRALQLRQRGDAPIPEGQKVTLSWDWEDALVYPSDAS
jgi:spermidine/putrescine transport system ATP-binding protein